MPEPLELPPLPTSPGEKPIDPLQPGAGGWTPSQLKALAIAGCIGGAWALLDLADAPDLTLKRCLFAFGKGAIGTLGSYVGLKSAGPRKIQ
jgi:hypothetical protein